MKNTVFRMCAFIIILVIVLYAWVSVFKYKYVDGIYSLTKYYELEDNSVDLLVLGSSHAFESFNTMTLWNEYGISSYDLGGCFQPTWNSYYNLKEALKTQTPKLIVFEAYSTVVTDEYLDSATTIKNITGMRWSKNKIDDIKASTSEEDRAQFYLEYSQYHTRYKDISEKDFLDGQGEQYYSSWKGYYCAMQTTPLEYLDVSMYDERTEMTEKTEYYYRKIIELAQENNIPIMVAVAPFAGINDDKEKVYNKAGDIAKEYNVPFVNYNLLVDEIGLDYSTDCEDPSHLNFRGSQKFTSYFGRTALSEYNLPDHRGDERYSSWQENADCLGRMIASQEIKESWDYDYIVSKLQDENYTICVSIDGNVDMSNENLKNALEAININDLQNTGIYCVEDGIVIWNSQIKNEFFLGTKNHDIHLSSKQDENGECHNIIIVDGEYYSKVTDGINIMIYDKAIDEIVDCFGLDANEEYCIVR
ncbi:hypothetical protein [Pseudobutyrivibrio sp.]|uniref:hypothetical protein n=1 Tax=Pseudobutyrivibrio sp. TaxID=2014367 RepID=UPI003864ABFD